MLKAHLRLGLLVAILVTLVGHFTTRASIPSGSLVAFWIVLGIVVGFLVAVTMGRTSKAKSDEVREASEPSGAPLTVRGERGTTVSTTGKFFAITRTPSSSELRALMVDAPTIPGNPVSTRLKLIIEKYDHYVRIPLVESAPLEQSVRETSQWAHQEAVRQSPETLKDVNFSLTYLRSEGPLDSNARSPYGWTFLFVDGRLGIRCSLTLTPSAVLVVYGTAVSYPKVVEPEWIDPAPALRSLRESTPTLVQRDLYLRVNFPSHFFLFTRRPLAIFDIRSHTEATCSCPTLPTWFDSIDIEPFMSVSQLCDLLRRESQPPAPVSVDREVIGETESDERSPSDDDRQEPVRPVFDKDLEPLAQSPEKQPEKFVPEEAGKDRPTSTLRVSEQAGESQPDETPDHRPPREGAQVGGESSSEQRSSPASLEESEGENPSGEGTPSQEIPTASEPPSNQTEKKDRGTGGDYESVAADIQMARDLLNQDQVVVRTTAKHLFDSHGPAVVEELTAQALRADGENRSLCNALILLIAYLPSDLALLSLYDLAEKGSPDSKDLAQSLFDKRRKWEMGVFADPVEPLGFEESRALLGKKNCRQVALKSTYDPEGDLLPSLAGIGLKATRIRLLSGDTELFLSANLGAEDGCTEAFVSSSPLPMPCHILRIVGPLTERLIDRVKASSVVYSREDIISDVLSGRPYDLHRAALYMAALGIDEPTAFDALVQGVTSNRSNLELRRACLAALAQLDHEGVIPTIEGLESPELVDLAIELLDRCKKRSNTNGTLESPDSGERPT